MENIIFKPTPWQEISINENSTNIKYSILGFNLFNRSFLMGDIEDVKVFIKAVIITTSNGTFKFPIENEEERIKLVKFYGREIEFKDLIK